MMNNEYNRMKNFARVAQRYNYGLLNALGRKANALSKIDHAFDQRVALRERLYEKAWADYLQKFPESKFWSAETAGMMFDQWAANMKDIFGTAWDKTKALVTA